MSSPQSNRVATLRTWAVPLLGRYAVLATNPKLRAIGAAALGQVVMFGGMAVVSRHYDHLALAEYGVVFSLFNIIQLAASLRLEQGLVYEHAVEHRSSLYWLTLILIPVATLIVGAGAAIYIGRNPQTGAHAFALAWLLAVATLGSAMGRLHLQLLAAAEQYGFVIFNNVLRPSLIGLLQVAATFVASTSVALVGALALSQVLYATVLGTLAWRAARPCATSASDMKQALRRNAAFPLYSLPQNMLYTVSEGLVPLALPFLFPTSAAVALFWLASRAVFAPATVLAESIRPMVYRDIAVAGDRLRQRIARYALALGGPIALGLLVLALCGPTLFRIAFGAQWGDANSYGLVLGVLVLGNMASLPAVGALPVMGMQKHLFAVEVLGLIARAAIIFLPGWTSPFQVVAASTVVYLAIIGGFYGYVWIIAGRTEWQK